MYPIDYDAAVRLLTEPTCVRVGRSGRNRVCGGRSIQRPAGDWEVEERVRERFVAERVVPPLQLVVAETGGLQGALEQVTSVPHDV